MKSETAETILETIRGRETPYFIKYNKFCIKVDENVYPPNADSFFLADNLKNKKLGVKKGDKVLDYGTGTGILSLVSAGCGGNVIGVDINPYAVSCARENVERNGLINKIEIRQGGFEAIDEEEKFSVIAANLPFENFQPRDILEYSVYDPNFQMRCGLFDNLQRHLLSDGRIFFTYSERVQKIEPIEKFSVGLTTRVIDRRIIDEEIYLMYLIMR